LLEEGAWLGHYDRLLGYFLLKWNWNWNWTWSGRFEMVVGGMGLFRSGVYILRRLTGLAVPVSG
jgi:hypothetical protein